MANAIDKNEELEPEAEDTEEEEEEETAGDTLVESWETENGVIFELHGFPDHDEILVIEEEDEDQPPKEGEGNDDHTVALALNLEDLDEAIDLLKEIREKVVERRAAAAKARTSAKTRAK